MNANLPPLRLCPRCRITMQANRSQAVGGDYDTFTCLRCDIVFSYARQPQAPERQREHEHGEKK